MIQSYAVDPHSLVLNPRYLAELHLMPSEECSTTLQWTQKIHPEISDCVGVVAPRLRFYQGLSVMGVLSEQHWPPKWTVISASAELHRIFLLSATYPREAPIPFPLYRSTR